MRIHFLGKNIKELEDQQKHKFIILKYQGESTSGIFKVMAKFSGKQTHKSFSLLSIIPNNLTIREFKIISLSPTIYWNYRLNNIYLLFQVTTTTLLTWTWTQMKKKTLQLNKDKAYGNVFK